MFDDPQCIRKQLSKVSGYSRCRIRGGYIARERQTSESALQRFIHQMGAFEFRVWQWHDTFTRNPFDFLSSLRIRSLTFVRMSQAKLFTQLLVVQGGYTAVAYLVQPHAHGYPNLTLQAAPMDSSMKSRCSTDCHDYVPFSCEAKRSGCYPIHRGTTPWA